jgi:hypothetical protein
MAPRSPERSDKVVVMGEANTTKNQKPLHVEVAIQAMCPTPLATLRSEWQDYLESNPQSLILNGDGHLDLSALPATFQQNCLCASIDVDHEEYACKNLGKEQRLLVHTFILSEEEVSTEELEPPGGDDEWTAACDSLPLPHKSLDGLWESLIFEASVKRNLLQYAQSSLLFSDKAVSSHIVNWNRILLLYGPPGTGKTSLCRALAHKLAIRMGNRFSGGTTLLEINSHALFSKWFSTSGKLVSKLFQLVRDMVQDEPNTLVCVLIDEVESLAASRGNLGGDPSDAMRAVNSLLTSLDRLRSFPNVLVLATTNLTGSVDAAFVDRVDLKIHIGLPILEARYEIFRSCLHELQRAGIITSSGNHLSPFQFPSFRADKECIISALLWSCAEQAGGLSGRSLRRLPLQGTYECYFLSQPIDTNTGRYCTRFGLLLSIVFSHAKINTYCRTPCSHGEVHAQFLHGAESVSMQDFLEGLMAAIEAEHATRKTMAS